MRKTALVLLALMIVGGSAWAGSAYYSGAPGETGIRFFDVAWPASPNSVIGGGTHATVTGFNTINPAEVALGEKIDVWTDVGGGVLGVNVNPGRVKGGFTLGDGLTPAAVQNGSAYVLVADWDVPTTVNVPAYNNPPQTTMLNARCYVGIDFDGDVTGSLLGGGGAQCMAGIEWNVTANAWRLGSDNGSIWGNNTVIPTPSHFALKITKKIAPADGVYAPTGWSYTAGTALVTVEYSADGGPWVGMPSAYGIPLADLPLKSTGLGAPATDLDVGPDYFAWSLRGLSAVNLKIRVAGAGVPDVNGAGSMDFDADGMTNDTELTLGADPFNADSDGDGLLDGVETNTGLFVSASDRGTSPIDTDSDNDGLLDSVETNTGAFISASDTGTSPVDADSDDDGLADNVETNTGVFVGAADTGTSPVDADADDDGALDGVETNTGAFVNALDRGTNPFNADTDDDGLLDGVETNTGVYVSVSNTGTNPLQADSDGDGLTDTVETNTGVFVDAGNTGTNPVDPDTDGDNLPDGAEVDNGSNPLVVEGDSDNDGIPDSVEDAAMADPDGDGIPNALDTDSDGDGVPDATEWNLTSDPYSADNPDNLPVAALPAALALLGIGMTMLNVRKK